MSKTFFLDQYGCAKNQVDGELIIDLLCSAGWQRTLESEKADVIIINSCGFIEDAKKESLNALFAAKKAHPKAATILAGCLSQRYGNTLFDDLQEADAICGNGDLSYIVQAAESVIAKKRFLKITEQKGVCVGNRNTLLSFAGSAYIKITEGCNNRCSFCAIPLIRGNLRSRPIFDIVEEAKSLIKRGVFELNLIGQDSASYGMDFLQAAPNSTHTESQSQLSLLLRELSKLSGDFWIRLLYIHPDNFPLDILPVIKADSRILPYFDIPFQSGSNEIIAKMNRRKTSEYYENLIEQIRRELPQTVLRTTFLTGFPAETESDFLQTCSFLHHIKPDWSGCFVYSKEEDTQAALFKSQVPKKTAKQRKAQLESIQTEITQSKMLTHVGKTYEVLIEETQEDFSIGRAWFQAPEVDGAVVVMNQNKAIECGKIVKVCITGCTGVDLKGVLADFS